MSNLPDGLDKGIDLNLNRLTVKRCWYRQFLRFRLSRLCRKIKFNERSFDLDFD